MFALRSFAYYNNEEERISMLSEFLHSWISIVNALAKDF